MAIAAALDEIVSTLIAAGLRATAEPSKVQTPGVLVLPGDIAFDRLSDEEMSMDFDIYLISKNNGGRQTLAELEGMLYKVQSVYPIAGGSPLSVPLSNLSPDPLPALLVRLPVNITKE